MHREEKISNYYLAAYCAVCLLLLSLPLSSFVASLKAGVVYVMAPIIFTGDKSQERLAQLPSGIRDLISADQENRALREQLRQALWLQDNLQQESLENARLRGLLGLKAPNGRTPLWAHVMAKDSVNLYHSFLVDAGQDENVAIDDPVLGRFGSSLAAVGRVVEVRADSSVVLLLTDEFSSVAADISSGTVEGLIQGRGEASLLLNYLPQTALPQVGETVYTSATSAVFPADIPLGTVTRVRAEDAFLAFKSAVVRPVLDAASLSDVAILERGPLPARPKEAEAKP